MLNIIYLFRSHLNKLINNQLLFGYLYSYCSYYVSIVLYRIGCKYLSLVCSCNAIRRLGVIRVGYLNVNFVRNFFSDFVCNQNDFYENLFSYYQVSKFYFQSLSKFHNERIGDQVRLRYNRTNSGVERQGNLMILKYPRPLNNEKGVILLKYNESFEDFVSFFDLKAVSLLYRFVFEPSSYRNILPSLFFFAACGGPHVFQASQPNDRLLLRLLIPNIHAVDLGSGDWVDFRTFRKDDVDKVYDVVMVASWARLKRHHILFSALQQIQKRGRPLRCALIGYPLDMTKENIVDLAESFGIRSSIDIYENILPIDVARIVTSSKVAVHLSQAEGPNKASYEAMMCNVPIIVYKYNDGFRKEFINSQTGIFADDDGLSFQIEYVIDNIKSFSPRSWLLRCGGFKNSTSILNTVLKQIALQNNEGWSSDIVAKINQPNLYYAYDDDRVCFESAYEDLKHYLRHKR